MPEFVTVDGHRFDSYEQRPDGARAAIVIAQEIFGVNAHIRSVVDRYAALGFHAIAPALFDRARRGVELEYDADGIAAGREILGDVNWDDSLLDVAATVEHVASTGPSAVIGYCYGGSIAWLSASSTPVNAAVGYYGGQVHTFIDRTPRVPTMLHFGELDGGIPLSDVHAVAAAHPEVIVHTYSDADHGFNCDARGSYHESSAALALERTLDFLASHGVTR